MLSKEREKGRDGSREPRWEAAAVQGEIVWPG